MRLILLIAGLAMLGMGPLAILGVILILLVLAS